MNTAVQSFRSPIYTGRVITTENVIKTQSDSFKTTLLF